MTDELHDQCQAQLARFVLRTCASRGHGMPADEVEGFKTILQRGYEQYGQRADISGDVVNIVRDPGRSGLFDLVQIENAETRVSTDLMVLTDDGLMQAFGTTDIESIQDRIGVGQINLGKRKPSPVERRLLARLIEPHVQEIAVDLKEVDDRSMEEWMAFFVQQQDPAVAVARWKKIDYLYTYVVEHFPTPLGTEKRQAIYSVLTIMAEGGEYEEGLMKLVYDGFSMADITTLMETLLKAKDAATQPPQEETDKDS